MKDLHYSPLKYRRSFGAAIRCGSTVGTTSIAERSQFPEITSILQEVRYAHGPMQHVCTIDVVTSGQGQQLAALPQRPTRAHMTHDLDHRYVVVLMNYLILIPMFSI